MASVRAACGRLPAEDAIWAGEAIWVVATGRASRSCAARSCEVRGRCSSVTWGAKVRAAAQSSACAVISPKRGAKRAAASSCAVISSAAMKPLATSSQSSEVGVESGTSTNTDGSSAASSSPVAFSAAACSPGVAGSLVSSPLVVPSPLAPWPAASMSAVVSIRQLSSSTSDSESCAHSGCGRSWRLRRTGVGPSHARVSLGRRFTGSDLPSRVGPTEMPCCPSASLVSSPWAPRAVSLFFWAASVSVAPSIFTSVSSCFSVPSVVACAHAVTPAKHE
eukprot:scaffold51632_cov82-Phaeocystis_antarctica.AAC.1